MHRNQGWFVFHVALLLFFLALVTGCGGKDADEKRAEKIAEKLIEKAGGGKADVNIQDGKVSVKGKDFEMESGETDRWPENMPEYVPEFPYGKVSIVTDMSSPSGEGRKIDVHFTDLRSGAVDLYQKDLEKAGWEIQTVSQAEEGGMLMAAKGEMTHLVFAYSMEDREGTVMVFFE